MLDEDTRYDVWPNWDQLVPAQFRSMGFSWWWGVVLRRLFRMQPRIEKNIVEKSADFVNGALYTWNGSMAGIHVRRGDKSRDGWRPRSLQTAIRAVQRSSECANYVGVCNNSRAIFADNANHFPVYVASDDPAILEEASALGFMVSPAGVSQEAGAQHVFTEGLLSAKKSSAFQASIEIIRDIYYLSKCSTLVGTASSQVQSHTHM